jgi:Ca-activated chloride channel homolog
MTGLHLSSLSLIVAMLFGLTANAFAQGVLVDIRIDHPIRLPRPIPIPPRPIPRPPSSYKIDSIEVNAKLTNQVARVQVSQVFENTGSIPMEVSFVFPLPYDGAIDQLTLLVDGKEFQPNSFQRKKPDDATKKSSARIATRHFWNGSAMACSRRMCSQFRRVRSAP